METVGQRCEFKSQLCRLHLVAWGKNKPLASLSLSPVFLLCFPKAATVPELWCNWDIHFPLCTFLSALSRCFSQNNPECEDAEVHWGKEPPWLLPVAAEALRQAGVKAAATKTSPPGSKTPLYVPSKKSVPPFPKKGSPFEPQLLQQRLVPIALCPMCLNPFPHSLPTSSVPPKLGPVFHLITNLSPTPQKKQHLYLSTHDSEWWEVQGL